ncbi:MAG: hypothetical protein U5L06_00545 [Rhodovibrio sp.]|nr:hypothetical protein [Rhodovibrio sp.]
MLSCWEAPEEGLVSAWGQGEGAQNYAEAVETRQWTQLDRPAAACGLEASASGARGWPRDGQRGGQRWRRRGNPRSAIPRAVGDTGRGPAGLGTVARTGVPGLIIGNTAEDVLNSVDIGIVAAKPPGYVSPVQGG